MVRTAAAQEVRGFDANKNPGRFQDIGYNVHFVDPSKATNTMGCIGVQNLADMTHITNPTLTTAPPSTPTSHLRG